MALPVYECRAGPPARYASASGTASKTLHERFGAEPEPGEDRLVALEVDRIGQFGKHFADEVIPVPGMAQDPRDFLVRPVRRLGAHASNIRSGWRRPVEIVQQRNAHRVPDEPRGDV